MHDSRSIGASPGVLRIGTRGSELARWQARRVQALLGRWGTRAELVTIRTSGDAPARPRGTAVKGLFTKEIEEALLAGRIHMGVHSLKDLWITPPAGLAIAAYPEREDPRDALVTREGRTLEEMAAGARVGTSSLRRAAALRAARPDLTVVTLHGNVPTRLRKVEEGVVDGAAMALAGLKRLGLERGAVALDPAFIVPAPGQGAMAIEVVADDGDTGDLVHAIDDRSVRIAVEAERGALAVLGSGCNVPVGATCFVSDGEQRLRVAIYGPDGEPPLVTDVAVDPAEPATSGRQAADDLLRRGGRDLIDRAARWAAQWEDAR